MNRFISYIVRMLSIQALIMFVSLPIVIAWGLPISLLGLLGNVFFLPSIILFLLISAMFVLLLPFGLPAAFLGYLLDCFVSIWRSLVSLDSSLFQRAFPFYGYLPLGLVFCLVILVLHARVLQRLRVALVAGSILFLLLMPYGLFSGRLEGDFGCGGALLHFYRGKKGVCVIDSGRKRSVRGLDTWVMYRLPQFLAQRFGVVGICRYEVVRITPSICSLIELLCREGVVEEVVVRGITKKDKVLIARLQKCSEQSGIPIRF